MPLADFTAESLALFEAGEAQVLVERVKFLSARPNRRGDYDSGASGPLNQPH